MIKVVLFDFWGTLVNQGTHSPLKQTYNIVRVPLSFSEFVPIFEEVFMTKSFKEQAEGFGEVFKAFSLPQRPFLVDKLIGLWNKTRMLAELYPDTVVALEDFKKRGVKMGLVSNTDQLIHQVIERFDLAKFFDGLFFSYELGVLKQDKKFFEQVCKKFGVKAGEVLMVGDSVETDMVGAENAGVTGVLVDRNNKREFKRKIASLVDAVQFLEG